MFEVLRAVLKKMADFRDIIHSRLVYRYQRVWGACYLHLQGTSMRVIYRCKCFGGNLLEQP